MHLHPFVGLKGSDKGDEVIKGMFYVSAWSVIAKLVEFFMPQCPNIRERRRFGVGDHDWKANMYPVILTP